MTEIEKAIVHYDGDNSKPYCDLVYKGLKLLQLLGDTDGQSTYDVFSNDGGATSCVVRRQIR
jgi:hypothetical protein